jgi:two-component system, cell cycle response regulator DivK
VNAANDDKKRVLVADDNPVSRELIREILEYDHYEVIEAGDGGEALKKVREHRPDLALLDIQMPEMDGTAVVREIRADPTLAHIPVAALTAYAMQGDRERALAAGFTSYITKPIEIPDFRAQIAKLLGKRGINS